MGEYVEIKDKNVLKVSNTKNPVKIRIECQYGTISGVSFYNEKLITVECGGEVIVGEARKMHNKTIEFNGSSGNPDEGEIKIIHTIYEEGGNEIVYTFPDDYTGNPDFDENDPEPSYVFYVKFISL